MITDAAYIAKARERVARYPQEFDTAQRYWFQHYKRTGERLPEVRTRVTPRVSLYKSPTVSVERSRILVFRFNRDGGYESEYWL